MHHTIKKEALAQVFSCEFCEISKSTFFYKTPRVAASVYLGNNDKKQIIRKDLVYEIEFKLSVSSKNAHSPKHMKRRFMEHFVIKIILTNLNGKPDGIMFFTNTCDILFAFV